MRLYCKNRWVVILVSVFFWAAGLHAGDEVFLREAFESLDAWEPLHFRGIDRHTSYVIQPHEDAKVLVAQSDRSASALVFKKSFDVAEFPVLRWRWKVDNVFEKANYRLKSGDDYPMRVYVLFDYDPEKAGFGMKVKYELAKAIYGRYPPHSSVNYIWTSRTDEIDPVPSPYTDRSIMIPLRHGPRYAGQWVEEQVNVLADYRRTFGEDPPSRASLAIMSDADNTGESATAYIQFIEVRKSEAQEN